MEIGAGKFKAQCLKLMDYVKARHETIIITKHGKPIAKLVPVETEKEFTLFGSMAGTVLEEKDIITPLEEEWEVDE
ncbi:MAG: type II toxin-antitoxin system prevent-host-death family antitoxin [Spirochaetota bacterium]